MMVNNYPSLNDRYAHRRDLIMLDDRAAAALVWEAWAITPEWWSMLMVQRMKNGYARRFGRAAPASVSIH